jgi:hypothetical protein
VVLVDEPPRLDVLGELVRRGPVTSLRRAGKCETANGTIIRRCPPGRAGRGWVRREPAF